MVRAIMHGCNGHMGQVITGLIKDDPEIEIVAGVDPVDCRDNGYPVFPSIDKCTVEADVIIDFTSAKAVDGLIAYSAEKKVPVVLCTTGLSEEQLKRLEEASSQVAVLRSANMSLGINMLMKFWQQPALTWRSWRSITTASWMRPVEQLLLWQMLSMMACLTVNMNINMTEVRIIRNARKKRLVSLRYVEELL